MAINFIESNYAVGNGSTNTFTMSVPTTTIAGDLLVVFLFDTTDTGGGADAVTDNLSNVYANIFNIPLTSYSHTVSLWYLIAPAGVTTINLTLLTGSFRGGSIVSHFNGVGSLDQSASPSQIAQSTPWASTAITTRQASELLIGVNLATVNVFNSGAQNANSWNGIWTNIDAFTVCAGSSASPCTVQNGNLDGNNGSIISMAYQIVSAIETNIQATGTNNSSTNTYYNFPAIASFFGPFFIINQGYGAAVQDDMQWLGGDNE